MAESGIFLRKASGLVRDWSFFDAFAFQSWSQPLGISIFMFAYACFWPGANMVLSIVWLMIFATFQCFVYTFMVVAMPRAGADYVWQSRVLNPALGFMVTFPAWCFLTIFWVPWNTWTLALQHVTPMMLLLGQNIESANWWSGNDAIYLMTIATMVYSGIVAAFGMKWYARVQYILYWIAMIGVFVVIVAFAISSHSTFVANFNTFWTNRLGYSGANAYQDIIDAAKEQGLGGVSQVNWDWGLAAPLLPLNLMWGLWSTWAAPLYGEVRGVKSFWKTHLSFQMTNIPLNFLNILVILGIWSIASNEFYQSANYLFWMGDTTHMPMFASVPFWSYLLTGNVALTVFIHLSIIAWYSLLNGAGNTYLIISRFMFAMSYDQALPSWFASLKTTRRIPAYSYLWCFLITLVIGWFYSYNWHGFRSLNLDASFAFVIVFCFTSLVAILLPFTRRSIFKASPAAKYVIGGIPIQVICGIGFIGMSIYVIYQWLVDANYGVNSPLSAQFMVLLYAIGVVIFLAFKYYRKSKGIDLNLTYQQIPPD